MATCHPAASIGIDPGRLRRTRRRCPECVVGDHQLRPPPSTIAARAAARQLGQTRLVIGSPTSMPRSTATVGGDPVGDRHGHRRDLAQVWLADVAMELGAERTDGQGRLDVIAFGRGARSRRRRLVQADT